MLSDLFGVLKDALVDHVRLATGYQPTVSVAAPVSFIRSPKIETVDFADNSVTMMLLNIEEDRKAMPADPYRRTAADGTRLMVRPPIALNVFVLFVARFSNYADSLRHIDLIVQFFQKHRAMDPSTMPKLVGKNIDKIACELFTVPLSELNHIWGPLNTAYQPSLVYRFRVVFYHDMDGVPAAAAAQAPIIGVSGSSSPPPTTALPASEPARWAYYCITDLTDAASRLEIMDTDPANPLVFSPARNLGVVPDASDALGTYLVGRHPGEAVLRFVSNASIAADDEPRRNIELRLEGEVLSRPLSNPSKNSLSRIDVALPGNASNPADVLMHVIEYRSQITQTTT